MLDSSTKGDCEETREDKYDHLGNLEADIDSNVSQFKISFSQVLHAKIFPEHSKSATCL